MGLPVRVSLFFSSVLLGYYSTLPGFPILIESHLAFYKPMCRFTDFCGLCLEGQGKVVKK